MREKRDKRETTVGSKKYGVDRRQQQENRTHQEVLGSRQESPRERIERKDYGLQILYGF